MSVSASDFSHLKADYDRDGFAIVRGLLPPEQFEELRSNLDRYIAEIVPTLPDSDAFFVDKARPETLKQMQHMGGDAYFREYVKHPIWNAVAEALNGEPSSSETPEWFNKPAGTDSPTPPHQDNYYFCLEPPHVLTMWMALDRVDEENGCLRYVRGSHLEGVRPHGRSAVLGFSQGILDYGPDDEAREVPICLEPGDVAVHHGNMIHRADPNRTADRSRRSFAMVFRGESVRRDEEAYARYMDGLRQQHQEMGLATT
ncbi:MAG: phytanoyl-CoA dioxygenase family protein [Planctomycetota bacterium]|nr:MAG: phytanoyl-CoA dioxygenase family protein [Planctomycetota bacterium]REJ88537.1 MAG: phytanoyl-CoA dioxygenase family protein [Planctomycetota bacterium]REK22133.1 MAG: phytanoyl-CoA dioxygenase family protein [Planctomycetota bacterium]REK34945.1 MAG: phytanoyl-CoA dioxygenase family protein [Planctomycetota bacterium]